MAVNDLPLQSLIWPEAEICPIPELYVTLSGGAALASDPPEIRFEAEGVAGFGTAMNLFNLGKWQKYCGLTDLVLELEGQGRFDATIWQAKGPGPATRLTRQTITLRADTPFPLTCAGSDGQNAGGVLYLELRALGPGLLRQAHWRTHQPPRRAPDLMLSITTFRREEAVQAAIRRFRAFARHSPLADHIHLTVVDNGQSLPRDVSTAAPNVTVLRNANFGGSGGFARGLLAARARGASHCLFMDDDATVPFQAVERTVMFLAHAKDEAVAINGALTHAARPWAIWENGARFDVFCRPAFQGTDLRQLSQVVAMELGSTADKPATYYGGWWYFAFPVALAQHMPFPFFVRGDDIGFSLMNRFQIVPLPGAICFQNEDFSAKESPRTIYLDLRSHFAHHLYAPHLPSGGRGAFKVPVFFFLRFLVSCHYDTLAAVNLSFRDALSGPAFYRDNLDMSARFKDIADLIEGEKWRPVDKAGLVERRRINPDRRVDRWIMKATLNGHLLPFFSRFGNHLVLPSTARGHRRAIWGAARITYLSADRTQAYTVTHDKRRALRQTGQVMASMVKLVWRYRALRAAWRSQYPDMTSRQFWRDVL